MPITSNAGGVLHELDIVTNNVGGVLHELDVVHSNVNGVLKEIFSSRQVDFSDLPNGNISSNGKTVSCTVTGNYDTFQTSTPAPLLYGTFTVKKPTVIEVSTTVLDSFVNEGDYEARTRFYIKNSTSSSTTIADLNFTGDSAVVTAQLEVGTYYVYCRRYARHWNSTNSTYYYSSPTKYVFNIKAKY